MKPDKTNDFFSAAEMKAIRKAVAVAETGTSGQIAPMIVDESDSYREALLLGVLFLSGLLALIVAIAIHHVTIWTYIPLVVVLALPCYLLLRRFPRIKLAFIGRKRINEAVQERAVRAFYEKGLYRTRHETGVLIFISLLERKVWILGDRGINEKITPDSWQTLAGELAKGIRQGKTCESLCTTIRACGEELTRYFPQAPGTGINELPDDLLVSR
ncbi:TPM domain-containing protein [Geotalea sp. SG265]|uniref:TPM domain-containing protein n=1 Tax=Geotalea sp. SG265 TaxID=2922867 RepID=UPI001FAFDE0A|nr:TPM domain-containing protein [Geotalea sp. SG265]